MNDGRGARVQTRLDATSPILHGNLAHIFRAGSKVWAAGGVSHLREDEPAPRTGAGCAGRHKGRRDAHAARA